MANKQLEVEKKLKWLGPGVRRFKWLSHLEPLFKPGECKW